MLSQSALIERFSKEATRGSASHMLIEDDVLYSYGSHFPLAIRQDWGQDIRYLVNGDHYSATTSMHQRHCFGRLTPNVQVPFSALSAAGLADYGIPNRDLEIVSNRPDEFHYTCSHCDREVENTDEALDPSKLWTYHHIDDLTPLCAQAHGETISHHVLGAVVLEHEGRSFLSSIDEQEGWRMRAYFLCLLPKPVASIEDAFDSLVPDEVRNAKESGIEVRRQGDIFLLAARHSTREIHVPTEHHAQLFNTTHVATEVRVNGAVYVRGTLRHQPDGRHSQHRMLRLGRSWWIAIKNLALASWNAVGSVD